MSLLQDTPKDPDGTDDSGTGEGIFINLINGSVKEFNNKSRISVPQCFHNFPYTLEKSFRNKKLVVKNIYQIIKLNNFYFKIANKV